MEHRTFVYEFVLLKDIFIYLKKKHLNSKPSGILLTLIFAAKPYQQWVGQ